MAEMGGLMLEARRWTKYGHDRVYVTHENGAKIGYIDLKTGASVIDFPEWTEHFYAAVGPYLSGAMEAGLVAAIAEADSAPSLESARIDLARNRPGEGAREEADDKLAAMRERSKFRTFLARALDTHTDERAWRKGAEGEEYVGEKLEGLREYGWQVLHSIPVGERGSDIDHMLIGPGGVFSINTKNHPGKKIWVAPNQMRVDGYTVPYLRNSRFEAERAGTLLSARVGWPVVARGVIVLLTGGFIPDITVKSGGPSDVWILHRWNMINKFKSARRILQPAEVGELFAAARRPETWSAAG